MLKCIFVPVSVFIEYEDLLGLLISEYQLIVERVHIPELVAWNYIRFYLLQTLYVNCNPPDHSEQPCFVEDHLLSMGKKFRMEGEVVSHRPFSGEGDGEDEERHDEEVGGASEEATSEKSEEIISESGLDCCISMVRFV